MSEAGSGGKVTVKKKLSRHARSRSSADMATREEEERHAANSGTDDDGLSDSEDETTSEDLDEVLARYPESDTLGNTQNLPNLINDICKLSFASTLGEQTIPVPVGSIKFESLSCGHTNTCLRAVQGRCLSTHPQLSEGTRFDMGNVEKKDDQFAEAVTNGLNWCVLESHVLREYPQMRIIQKLLCGTVCPQCDDGFCGEPEDHPDGLHLCDNPACRYAKEHF
jgi:hypothetical protein